MKKDIAAQINAELASYDIPRMTDDVIDWKMHRAVCDAVKAREKKRKKDSLRRMADMALRLGSDVQEERRDGNEHDGLALGREEGV